MQMNVSVCAIAFLVRSHGTIHNPTKNSAKTQISNTVHDPWHYSSLKNILL